MDHKEFTTLASEESISQVKKALTDNGFKVLVAQNRVEAKRMVLEILPEGAAVMENTSKTLDEIGITEEIDESEKYISIHNQALTMNRETEGKRIAEIRSVTDWSIGSFHAVTLDGKIMMASGSGSQIPGYAYGADHVIYVAGTQKIVKDIDTGFRRIYEHALPLESERIGGSNARRILIINSEKNPERTTVILVKEVLGF